MRRMRLGDQSRHPERRRAAPLLLALLICIAGSVNTVRIARAAYAREDAHDIAALTTDIEDMEVAVQVTNSDMKELDKIGKDFKSPYILRNLTLQYKQPDKLRLEGRSPVLGSATLILNGAIRFYCVPKFHKRETENLENAPSKRQSLLEYGGLISPDTLRFMQARFVRQETLGDCATSVFDLTYTGLESGSHYRLWIDPKTRVTLKREWYGHDNTLRATFSYQTPKEVSPGVWLPSRVEIKNGEGVVAATMTYGAAKINKGLDDSLFAVKQ